MYNILQPIENGRVEKVFTKGLSRYVQDNCQVTITDRGFRIYRTANISASDHNMWGGLKIQPYGMENRDILQKGHTYIIKFHVEGKSSNKNNGDLGWSNNMGWGGGGLMPQPSNVTYQWIPDNFKGSMDCFYKWTINDDVYKTCTSAYSSFVLGTSYLSYRDFCFGWGYANTGEMGTDVYITNIRMYDLTDGGENPKLLKTGVVKATINENSSYSRLKMYKDGDISSSEFIEL